MYICQAFSCLPPKLFATIPSVMETEFLTKKELEKFLRISHGMVDKLMKTRQISFIKIGKKVLFRKADVEAWLETKRVK